MSASGQTRGAAWFGRWLLLCFTFYAIPLLLVGQAMEQGWSEEAATHERLQIERLERILSRLELAPATPWHLGRALDAAARRALAAPDWPAAWRPEAEKLRRRFPNALKFTVTDGRGTPLPELCDGRPPRRVLQSLMTALRARARGDNRPLERDWSLLRAFLGPLVRPNDLKGSDIQAARYGSRDALVFLSPPHPRGLIVAHVDRPRDFEALATLDRIAHLRPRLAVLRFGLLDGLRPLGTALADLDASHNELLAARAALDRSPTTHARVGDALWGRRLLSPTLFLLGRLAAPGDPGIAQRRCRVFAVLVLLFTALAATTAFVLRREGALYLPIRLKLVFLFLYTAALPLAVLGFTARGYFLELRSRLENDLQLQIERSLLQFDKDFPRCLGALQLHINRVLSAPMPASAPTRAEAIARLQTLASATLPDAIALVNPRGRTEWQAKDRGDALDIGALVKLLQPLLADMLSSLVPASGPEEPTRQGGSLLLGSLAGTGGLQLESMVAELATSLGRFSELRFRNRRTAMIFVPVLDHAGATRYLAMFGWSQRDLQMRYIRYYMHHARKRLVDTWLWASNRRFRSDKNWPPDFRHASLAIGSHRLLLGPLQAVKTRQTRGRTTWLVSGVRGNELENYNLIAVTADAGIRRTIDGLRRRLGLLSLGVLLITWTVGSLLAASFLTPVAELTAGVRALHARSFTHRLPALGRDELGDLAATFNQMMEGMADLEVARIVQESLFPQEPVTLGATSAYGRCVPASQVSGDYFDCFPLPGDRLALLIGDVSGHGVGAAMVMAMAKGVIANLAAEARSPAAVLQQLNSVLLATLHRAKMMTCFFALLEPGTGRLVFSSAGHNAPILVRAGATTSLESPNFPLGTRTRARFADSAIDLQAGDRLLLYTDGLVEAMTPQGGQIGYPRLLAELPSLLRPGATPRANEAALRAWFQTVVAPGPQDDDITLLFVHHGPDDPAASGPPVA